MRSEFGAADKIRTCDLDLRRVALCSAELRAVIGRETGIPTRGRRAALSFSKLAP